MQRDILLRGVIAGVLIAIVFVGILYLPSAQQTQQAQDEDSIKIIPILRIYDSTGKLIYEKIGDPPTDNLAKLFFWMIAPRYNNDGSGFGISATSMDGTAKTFDPDLNLGSNGGDEHTAWVVAGTGTNPTSLQDYTVNLVGYSEAKVLNMFFDTATNEWVLQLTGVVSFASSYNVTEVGLAVDTYGTASASSEISDPSSYPGNNFLVFRDLLPQPISVTNGDSITIQYEIRIKMP